MSEDASPAVEPLLQALETGEPHRFADWPVAAVPRSGAIVYTVWDREGRLVYVGMAGRGGQRSTASTGPFGRLASHASGRRSGDQFCVYVADHYVMPELTREQIVAVRDGELSMDELIRDHIHRSFGFRFAVAENYAAAMSVENRIKRGALGRPPRLNPGRR